MIIEFAFLYNIKVFLCSVDGAGLGWANHSDAGANNLYGRAGAHRNDGGF